MIKIGFLLGNFQTNGGIGRVTSILADELCKKDNMKVIAISYFKTDAPVLYDVSEEVVQYSLFSSAVSMAKAILKYNAVKKLKEIIVKEDLDIIVGCGALYYPLVIMAAKGTKAKVLCWEHTDPASTSDYNFQGVARKLAVKKADGIVVLTKSAQKYYLETLKAKENKLYQLYNPVAKDAAKSEKYNSSSKKIISVGRLTYQKNFSALIDVAMEVLPKYPDWTWDIFGEGEEREELTAKIESKNLVGKVNLMGQVYDLYDRYGDYSFQVMTSRYEGFPMSLIEGAVNRLPLISYDIATGPDEIIEDGVNGFLVEKENTDEMAEKICVLIEKADLRETMSQKAYEMTNNFCIDNIIDGWCELCKNMKN